MTNGSACPANIGPNERRRRAIMGAVMAAIVVALALLFIMLEAPRPWRLLIVLPAWIAALDFFQVRANTCVLLAARGVRNMDDGNVAVADRTEDAQLRAQARSVHLQSALAAAAITALVVLL